MQDVALGFSLFAMVAAVAGPAQAASDEKSVADALEAWKQAMLNKDRSIFEKIYHPDLVYAYHQRENGTLQVVPLVVMTVWSKGAKGWQMLGRQASKPPAPAPVAAATK